ncbi:hypothetical protein CDAR_45981 [Caerostris darwini]|uniref:Uncharacterized protein n=1 Tax=Caerostris darwini TaxID=1538125 RepID=A0AAV4M6H8_9ARAC|nr:hypothetical protein CDAR_45981 [Caerostris darwini]
MRKKKKPLCHKPPAQRTRRSLSDVLQPRRSAKRGVNSWMEAFKTIHLASSWELFGDDSLAIKLAMLKSLEMLFGREVLVRFQHEMSIRQHLPKGSISVKTEV